MLLDLLMGEYFLFSHLNGSYEYDSGEEKKQV